MTSDEILFNTEADMEKSVEHMVQEFASVRTGKASPALVDNIEVEAYGTLMKLKQLALISTPEPRLLVIQPFDAATTKDIERGIKESRLGINPVVDGKIIRIPIPELSEGRRRDLAKSIKQMAEEARVRVRANRRDGMESVKKLKTASEITEDTQRDLEKEIQDLTNKFVVSIDKHVESKEADIMRV